MTKLNITYQKFYPLLKWILALASIAFFIFQWKEQDVNWNGLTGKLQSNAGLLAIVIILMFLNWYLESSKFRILISSYHPLGRLKAFLIVLAGTTISNFTPARTGDYIGRSVLLKELAPIKVVLATITGNIFQVCMTYGLGLLALAFLFFNRTLPEELFDLKFIVLISGGSILLITAIIVIVSRLAKRQGKLPSLIQKVVRTLSKFNGSILKRVGLLSLLRYITFSIQFYLLLLLFTESEIPIYALGFIPVIYLLQSLVPVPAVTDIGFRIYFTAFFFSAYLTVNEMTMAVSVLWFINLIIPAIIGAFYLLYSLFAPK